MDQEETNEKLDNITGALRVLIEKTRVKAGLLKLEAKDAWEDIATGLTKIEKFLERDLQKTQQDVDEARLKSHLGMMEAREEWNEFKHFVEEAAQRSKVGESLDRSVLQMHLAKMDVSDRFKDQKEEWRKSYNTSVKPQLKKSMEEMKKEMEIFAQRLVD